MAMGIPNAATRTLLGNALTNIHVHSSPSAHQEFLQDSTPASSTGFTFRDPYTAGIPIISSVFESCTNCAGHPGVYSVTDQELKEFAAHELGHAADTALGDESVTATYSGYVRRDNANLDYVVIAASQAASVRRLPCGPTPNPAGGNYPDLPPFVGVMAFPNPDQPPVQMCVGTALNPALGAIPPTERNSSILKNFAYGHTTNNGEVFAQTFAFKAAASAANYADPSADGVFARSYLAGKPYFACSVGRATQLVTGAGAIPAECTVAVPAWYIVP